MATQNPFDTNPSLADYAAVLSPTIFNIAQSFTKPDKFNYISPNSLYSPNKNAGAALDILSKRKYDPTQALYRNMQNANTAKYNARNLNTNSGANQAYDIMMATNRMGQDAELLNQTQQMNNQYQGDYANALMQSGAQDAAQESQAKQAATQYNAQQNLYNMQSKAAKQNALGAGLTQLSNLTQSRMRDRSENEMKRFQAAMWLQSLVEQGKLPGNRNSMQDMVNRFIVPQLGYNPFENTDYSTTNASLLAGISPFTPNLSYSTPMSSALANTRVK